MKKSRDGAAVMLEKTPDRTGPSAASLVDRRADAPLYVQLARVLKDEIVSGVFPVGSLLPTEDQLRKRFAVSRQTIREALRQLREQNLIVSRRKTGTTVVPPRPYDSYAHDVASIRDLLAFAADAHVEFASIKMISIDGKLACRTQLPEGEERLALCGLGFRKGCALPVCWTEYYVNRAFARIGRMVHTYTGPIFPLIESLFGVEIVSVHQTISAVLVPPAMEHSLKVASGTPALGVRQTFELAGGEIAQVTLSVLPAERFQHSMTMRRVNRQAALRS